MQTKKIANAALLISLFAMLEVEQPLQAEESMKNMPINSISSNSSVTSPGVILGLVILIAGVAIVTGSLIVRSKRVVQDSTKFSKQAILSTKTFLALGVFAMLAGSILTLSNLLKPTSSTMQGMEGMSMEQMMRVDGSSNPLPVTVETVESGLLEASVRYTGTVRPYQEVTVYPRVAGQLTEYSVYPGDQVEAGQILARLNAEELSSDVEASLAETASSLSELEAARAGIGEQQQEISRMVADYSYWGKELPRAQTLLSKGVISQEEFDKEQSQAQVSQASVKVARAKLKQMQAQVDIAQSKISQSEVKTRRADILKSYTIISAPITGIIQERIVDPGVFVQPGMALFKIGDYSRVRLQANVAQQDAISIQVGTPIVAQVSGKSTNPVKGKITSIFPKAGEETRTVTVEANVDNSTKQLRAGQFLEMTIITARKADALSVPRASVTQFNGKPSVWVIAGEFAQHREITLGMTSGDRVEVKSNLQPGDQVITSGQERLIENVRVAIVDGAGKPVASLSNFNQGNVRIQLIGPKDNKAVIGDNQLILEVQDSKTGKPMPVEKLEVDAAMSMKNMAPMKTDVEVKSGNQPGRFLVKTYFGMRGSWQVNAKVKDKESQGQATFTLESR